MQLIMLKDAETKVGVQGDNDPLLLNRQPQQSLVAWVGNPFGGFAHVVTLAAQPLGELSPRATINKEPHPVMAIRSSRSRAITLMAYTRQA
jgi:hypothetical protein